MLTELIFCIHFPNFLFPLWQSRIDDGTADISDRLQLTSAGVFALLSNFNQLFELFLEIRFVSCQFDDAAHISLTNEKEKS